MIKAVISIHILIAIFISYTAKSQSYAPEYLLKQINASSRKSKVIVIVLPQEDCYKCRLPVYNLLQALKKDTLDNKLTLVALTDNYLLCKDFFSERNDIPIIASKQLTKQLAGDNKTCFYYIDSNNIAYKKKAEKIFETIELLKIKKSKKYSFSFADSTFSDNLLISSNSKGHLIFDEILQRGIHIIDTIKRCYQVDFKQKNSIKKIPRDIRMDTDIYKIIDTSESSKFLTILKMPLVRLKSIFYLSDSILYSRMTINHCYYDLQDDSNIVIRPSQVIAIINVAKHNTELNYFDISNYDSFYIIDSINIAGKGLLPFAGYPEYCSGGKTICFKMDTMDYQKNSTYYYGVARATYENNQFKFEHQRVCTSIPSNMPFLFDDVSNLFVTMTSSNLPKKVIFDGNTIFLNRKFGYKYIYDPVLSKKNKIIFYAAKPKGVYKIIIDTKERRIISETKLYDSPTSFRLTSVNGKVYSIYKRMINTDYNYGILSIQEASTLNFTVQ